MIMYIICGRIYFIFCIEKNQITQLVRSMKHYKSETKKRTDIYNFTYKFLSTEQSGFVLGLLNETVPSSWTSEKRLLLWHLACQISSPWRSRWPNLVGFPKVCKNLIFLTNVTARFSVDPNSDKYVD